MYQWHSTSTSTSVQTAAHGVSLAGESQEVGRRPGDLGAGPPRLDLGSTAVAELRTQGELLRRFLRRKESVESKITHFLSLIAWLIWLAPESIIAWVVFWPHCDIQPNSPLLIMLNHWASLAVTIASQSAFYIPQSPSPRVIYLTEPFLTLNTRWALRWLRQLCFGASNFGWFDSLIRTVSNNWLNL